MKLITKLLLHFFFLATTLVSSNGFALDTYIRGGDFSSYLSETDHYIRKVQPILDRRCVVCHSCFEAPCQMKLTSFEMLDRGANSHSTTGGMLSKAPRTDIAYTKEEQVKEGFFSVTKGGANSVMFNLLAQGRDKTDLPEQKFVDSNDHIDHNELVYTS